MVDTGASMLEPITSVIFRKYTNRPEELIAIFPYVRADNQGHVMSYQTVGQHGPASYHLVMDITDPAKPDEYAALKRELEGLGYNLRVVRLKRKKHPDET